MQVIAAQLIARSLVGIGRPKIDACRLYDVAFVSCDWAGNAGEATAHRLDNCWHWYHAGMQATGDNQALNNADMLCTDFCPTEKHCCLPTPRRVRHFIAWSKRPKSMVWNRMITYAACWLSYPKPIPTSNCNNSCLIDQQPHRKVWLLRLICNASMLPIRRHHYKQSLTNLALGLSMGRALVRLAKSLYYVLEICGDTSEKLIKIVSYL